jgi:hypothetical protein
MTNAQRHRHVAVHVLAAARDLANPLAGAEAACGNILMMIMQ